MKIAKRTARQLLIPADSDVEHDRSKLPQFPPHDAKRLVDAATSQGLAGHDVVAAVIQKTEQIDHDRRLQLLKMLGVDPAAADAWQQGFFKLACLYTGLGRFRFRTKKGAQNPRKWTPALNQLLISEMILRTERTGSESKALDELAATNLFPYTPKKQHGGGKRRTREEASKQSKRNALKGYWQQMKAAASLERQLGAIPPTDPEASLLIHLFLSSSARGQKQTT